MARGSLACEMATHMTDAVVRCAIYTRKSSEEGLSQAFNSLHAQREACEAYIASQATMGWRALPDQYDDGGHSGGGMNRPALRRLLAEVRADRLDVVVVYKVDRLTRSLADFARLIEALEANNVALVSVTQAFNTTSSMGKLTLNVLLSFAQFERDITGERIRDKVAASKARGMWMGGFLPLGYDPPAGKDGRLQVNEAEAETVRFIFNCYLEAGRFQLCQTRLAAAGVRSKRRVSHSGRLSGGVRFSNGALRYLLQNRIYIGEITHKGKSFAGRHDAIVDRVTFDAVGALLAASSRRRREHVSKADRSLLRGLLFDADGQPMEPIFGQTGTRTYAYYGSKPTPGLQMGGGQMTPSAARRRRRWTSSQRRGWLDCSSLARMVWVKRRCARSLPVSRFTLPGSRSSVVWTAYRAVGLTERSCRSCELRSSRARVSAWIPTTAAASGSPCQFAW